MRWQGRRRSSNVEDLRGQRSRSGVSGAGAAVAAPIIRMLFSKGGGKKKLVIIIGLVVAMMVFDIDPMQILGMGGGNQQAYQTQYENSATSEADNELAEFVAVVLADTEDTWGRLFKAQGADYKEPNLVLFSGATQSACGLGQSAMGPFYCPADQKIYIDLSFYRDLKNRYAAPGDFAQAYVIAHEVGHHLQTLFGISSKVHAQKRGLSKADANELSVRQELQADCFAGVWAHHAKRADLLEEGDVEEALVAAQAIGDDRLQKQATGRVVPESFTHGTSEQRQRWLKMGMKSGDVASCDTFSARQL